MGLRFFFLQVCDLLSWVISKVRELGSLSSSDLLIHDGKIDGPTPYDLVCTVETYNAQLDGNPTEVFWGDAYKIGVVIGYCNVSNQKPKLVKVAHFNTAEFKEPKIKLYLKEDLVVLCSPFLGVETQSLNRELVSKILDGVFGPDNDTDNIIH